MANTEGGDLVYGIEEGRGKASFLVPVVGETPDAVRRRLGRVLDAGLEPRLVGWRIHTAPIAGTDGEIGFVVRM